MRKRGPPLFFVTRRSIKGMITADMVRHIVEKHLNGTSQYLVDVSVRPGNKVVVEVDDDRAIDIETLVMLNKAIRSALGEASDDMELQVGSPGMGRPFKVARQYQKHMGRIVEVLLNDGRTLQGQLASHDQELLGIRIQHPSKVKGRLPKMDDDVTLFPLADIKATKAIIKFN